MQPIDHDRTLLFVDDDPEVREPLSRLLEKFGYTVIQASDTIEALQAVRQHPIDLIISDINMPGVSGFDLREQLVREHRTRDILFVFLTARSDPGDQVKGFDQGIDDFIQKPVDPRVLLARIKSVFERRRKYDSIARKDPLTGFLNRYGVELAIKKELVRQKRFDTFACMVFLDLDDFKLINDRHGHPTGDAVLVHLARTLKKHLRATDIVGRYGGEEFMIYLVGTRKPDAVRFTHRILGLFAKEPIGPDEIHAGFSAGVVESLTDGADFYQLYAKADQAMYQAKSLGKFRVIPWRSDGGSPSAPS